jgi:Fuc2NAc and GlcNAc transferase
MVTWLSVGIVAFLCFNLPPAKVFMGDVGSCALGYLIGCTALIFLLNNVHYFVASILFFGIFLCDTSLTLTRRYLAGEKVFDAHKKHAYQRFHQLGYSHKLVLLLNVSLQTLLSLMGLWVAKVGSIQADALGLIAMLIVFFVYYGYVERRNPMATA